MNRDDIDLLTGWRSPPPPPELKERVLTAVRDDGRQPVRRRLEDRLWESRAVRVGWLAAASLLLVLNLAMKTADRAPMVASANDGSPALDAEAVVGAPIPEPEDVAWTLADAGSVVRAILTDPCRDPLTEGDCS
jgi:hypothetical protein